MTTAPEFRFGTTTVKELRFVYESGHETEAYRDSDKLYREWKPEGAELQTRTVTTTDWESRGQA